MGLFNPFAKFFKKEPADENFLALGITPEKVLACVWKFSETKQVQVLGFCVKPFASLDNIIHQAAVAIDTAAHSAQSDFEKAVFGISDFYLEDGKPQEEMTKVIKSMSSDLELDPQAFVPLSVALGHLLKMEEGVMPRATFVGLFANFYEVHLFEGDKLQKSLSEKSQPTTDRVKNLISSLKEEDKDLPSRIVLYGSQAEDFHQALEKPIWQNIFTQEPKVDLILEDELAKSVAYAHAQDILGQEPKLTPSPEEEKKEVPTNEFGFMEGEDILLHKSGKPEAQPQPEPEAESQPEPKEFNKEDFAVDVTLPRSSDQKVIGPGQGSRFAFFFDLIDRLPTKNLALILVAFIVLILVASFVLSRAVSSAAVTIKVNAKPLEKDFSAKVASGVDLDLQKSQIPAQAVSAKVSGSQKVVATGSKKSGTNAKGTVKVLNWDVSGAKNFSSGTALITKDGLKFTLDSDITVASRSATTPGETKTTATAADFGTKSNITSGTALTIVGFDEVFYSALADTSFSGGDEKQATVASQDDLTRLERTLTDQLVENAKNQLKDKTSDHKIYDNATTVKVLSKNFDKKVGEEASLINLNMEVEVSTLDFKGQDLAKVLAASVNSDQSLGLVAREENIEILGVDTHPPPAGVKDSLAITGRFRANLVPKFDEDDLKNKIAGKSAKVARSIIKNIPQVTDVLFKFSPPIPFLDSLPHNKTKITFKVETA